MEAGRGRATRSEAGEKEEEKEELLGQHKTDCLFLLQSGAHSSHAVSGSMNWMASRKAKEGEKERKGGQWEWVYGETKNYTNEWERLRGMRNKYFGNAALFGGCDGRPEKNDLSETTGDFFWHTGLGEPGQWHEQLIERNKATISLFPLAPAERQFPYYLSYCARLGLARPTSYVEQYVKRCMDKPLFQCIFEPCYLWYFTGLYLYNIWCYSRDLVYNDFLIYSYAWVRLFFLNKLHLQTKSTQKWQRHL